MKATLRNMDVTAGMILDLNVALGYEGSSRETLVFSSSSELIGISGDEKLELKNKGELLLEKGV